MTSCTNKTAWARCNTERRPDIHPWELLNVLNTLPQGINYIKKKLIAIITSSAY